MTHNLVEYCNKRKVRTVLYNSSYQLAKGLKLRHESCKLIPGTYFKIENNGTNSDNGLRLGGRFNAAKPLL